MFLRDIQMAMERIAEYIDGLDLQKFKKDYKTVDAVIRNFKIIGEAAKNINDQLKENYPEVPWEEMYYLRNRISHEYFGIDYEIIWDIAISYLPYNKTQIETILHEYKWS